MVEHIMNQNRTASGGWKQPPYFAVTVPEHMGLDKYFTFEGLVWRVNPDTLQSDMDEEAVRHNIDELFSYRGLFKPDGTWDDRVYKDENASTLAHNYAAAFIQLGIHYRRTGRMQLAYKEMERVERMFPRSMDLLIPIGGFYIDAGDTARALALFERLTRQQPNNAEVRYYHGVTLVFQRRTDEALAEFEQAIRLDPEFSYAYMAAYSLLLESGQRERGIALLNQWVRRHPEDPDMQGLMQSSRGAPGGSRATAKGSPLPPPPPANVP
jgi:tetratricopeptide (TPR) repeat protein